MKNKDELLSFAAIVENCDVLGLMTEIINMAEEEIDNTDVYNALNTVAYTITEYCQV